VDHRVAARHAISPRSVVLSTSELQAPAMRLYEGSGYRLVRTELAMDPSHKTAGAGLRRFHYEKPLAAA
jgi:putative acetyltransferase